MSGATTGRDGYQELVGGLGGLRAPVEEGQAEDEAGSRKVADLTVVNDPWVHRSAGMSCRTCMWYAPKEDEEGAIPVPPLLGRCRRHAPTMSGYPVVFPSDWCGDHKVDGAKLVASGGLPK